MPENQEVHGDFGRNRATNVSDNETAADPPDVRWLLHVTTCALNFCSTFGFTLYLDRSGSCMGAATLLPTLPKDSEVNRAVVAT